MYVDPSSTIAGIPALRVRTFLRWAKTCQFLTLDYFRIRLRLSPVEVTQLVDELLRRDMLEPLSAAPPGEPWYRVTLAGNSFALASAARPISRTTADRKLSEFLDRVNIVNKGDKYLYRVHRALVFGSYLSETPKVNDIDVAVEIGPRYNDMKLQEDCERERIEKAEKGGRRFRNFVDRLAWPHDEVLLFLKSRSRAISLHTTDDDILETSVTRQVYPV